MGLYKLILLYLTGLTIFRVTTDWTYYIDKARCLVALECCHPNGGYIDLSNGSETLLDKLESKVYGQPLITKPIYRQLRTHLINDKPSRPLVMYFAGWTGTGKTYVAKLIASSIYKEGMRSKFVKYISSSWHFPVKIETKEEIAQNRQRLRDLIRDTVSQCERSLIILDELDKLPPGVVDGLQPMLDYVEDVDGIKYNKAIFIFLSNTGSDQLKELAYHMYKEGKERKDLLVKDVERILMQEAFKEPGGLRMSSLLKRHSIGIFVPFLPLERGHVELCIKTSIEEHGEVYVDDTDQVVQDVIDEIAFFPGDTQLFSMSGCKGVYEKVTNHLGPPVLKSETQQQEQQQHPLIGSHQEL